MEIDFRLASRILSSTLIDPVNSGIWPNSRYKKKHGESAYFGLEFFCIDEELATAALVP